MRPITRSRTRPERPKDAGGRTRPRAARRPKSVGSLAFLRIIVPHHPVNSTGGRGLGYSTASLREPRPELDERRAQPQEVHSFRTSGSLGPEDRAPQTWGDESKSPEDSEVESILTPTTVSSLAAARAALEQLEVADKANSRPSETVDLDEDVVARNTLAETNIARSTSRASNDSNRISIASQEDFKF